MIVSFYCEIFILFILLPLAALLGRWYSDPFPE